MLSKGKLSQIKTAFKSVYGVTNIDEQEVLRCGSEIIFYAEKFPFESDELMSQRFSSITELSDTDAILDYLAEVPEDTFSGEQKSTYGRLFELGKKFNVGFQEASPSKPEEAPTEVSSSNSIDNDGSGYNNDMEQTEKAMPQGTTSSASAPIVKEDAEAINLKIKQEETNMETNAIHKLEQEAKNEGIGSTVTTNVTEVSKNDKDAVATVIAAQQADRISYSENTKVTKVLVTSIDRAKKAVEGTAAMGYVSNPKKALETFISKTGCSVEDGIVKFSKLHSSQLHDDARKMYELLNAAVADPMTKVQPYFGKDGAAIPISVKGVVVNEPDGKKVTLSQKDIAKHILENGFLYLNVDSATNAQFQLDAAVARKGVAPKKSYIFRIANKADLLADESVCLMVKNITGKVSESKTGFKSAMAVTCNSSKIGENGEAKKITWRIPLDVEQFDVEVLASYADLFKSGVGNAVKPISAEGTANVESILAKITTLLAVESNKTGSDSMLGTALRSKINAAKTEIVAADANAVNNVLGGAAGTDDEFAG